MKIITSRTNAFFSRIATSSAGDRLDSNTKRIVGRARSLDASHKDHLAALAALALCEVEDVRTDATALQVELLEALAGEIALFLARIEG